MKIGAQAVYIHYSGRYYVYHGEAFAESDGCRMVIYQHIEQNAPGKVYVRPATEFFGHIESAGKKVKRFTCVGQLP